MTLPAVAAGFEATKKLAEQGYTSAQNDLGEMYAEGSGVSGKLSAEKSCR